MIFKVTAFIESRETTPSLTLSPCFTVISQRNDRSIFETWLACFSLFGEIVHVRSDLSQDEGFKEVRV